jgi:hypothetical protein
MTRRRSMDRRSACCNGGFEQATAWQIKRTTAAVRQLCLTLVSHSLITAAILTSWLVCSARLPHPIPHHAIRFAIIGAGKLFSSQYISVNAPWTGLTARRTDLTVSIFGFI